MGFIIGMVIGGILGIFTAAIVSNRKDDYEE